MTQSITFANKDNRNIENISFLLILQLKIDINEAGIARSTSK